MLGVVLAQRRRSSCCRRWPSSHRVAQQYADQQPVGLLLRGAACASASELEPAARPRVPPREARPARGADRRRDRGRARVRRSAPRPGAGAASTAPSGPTAARRASARPRATIARAGPVGTRARAGGRSSADSQLGARRCDRPTAGRARDPSRAGVGQDARDVGRWAGDELAEQESRGRAPRRRRPGRVAHQRRRPPRPAAAASSHARGPGPGSRLAGRWRRCRRLSSPIRTGTSSAARGRLRGRLGAARRRRGCQRRERGCRRSTPGGHTTGCAERGDRDRHRAAERLGRGAATLCRSSPATAPETIVSGVAGGRPAAPRTGPTCAAVKRPGALHAPPAHAAQVTRTVVTPSSAPLDLLRTPAPGSRSGTRARARRTGTPRGRARRCRRSPCSPRTSATGRTARRASAG